MSFTPEEVRFLAAGHFDHPELEFTPASRLRDVERLRAEYGDLARAVAELLKARRSGKLPGHWLADADSAQQATPPAVAQFRARYLASLGVDWAHDVTCSIGTEGHALASAGLGYFGSDLDLSRVLMARHNVPGAQFAVADALRPAAAAPAGSTPVIIADPARRAGGRRITDPAKLLPPLPDLVEAHHGREMAIKCAPGLDFSQWEGMVDIVSVAGGVKEACLYTPGLSHGTARRRAIMIDPRLPGGIDVLTPRCSAGAQGDDGPEAGEPGKYILDPDGAVVRAGLVRDYAAREGLWQLDPHIAFLTGPRLPAGTSGFEFIEAVKPKRLKSALAALDCGSLEVLVRGVDADPDRLRKQLKLKGNRALTVVLARVGNHPVAFICGARVSSSEG